MPQTTYVLDSNVYGELTVDHDGAKIIRNVKEDKSLYVYGLDIIREELMAVPAELVDRGGQIRKAVLAVYRAIVDEELILPPLAAYLASKYFEEFCMIRELSRYKKVADVKTLSKLKKFTEDDLRTDFQIVATASLIGADIVISMDAKNRLRTPALVNYSEFREKHLGGLGK